LSHLFTPEDHCPQTLRTAGLPPGSAFYRTHAAAVLAMHREHDGRVLGTDSKPRRTGFRTPLLASLGVRSDRRDPGQPRAFPGPVQRGHDDPPGQLCRNTWPGFPLPRLTDVLQSGDHLAAAWPPGETPVERASQCDGAVGLPVPAVEPGISRLTLAGDRASSAGRRTRSPRFLPIRRQLLSVA